MYTGPATAISTFFSFGTKKTNRPRHAVRPVLPLTRR